MLQWQTPAAWRGRELVHGCKSLSVRGFIGSLVTDEKKESTLGAQDFLWSKNLLMIVFDNRKLILPLFFEHILLAWMQHRLAGWYLGLQIPLALLVESKGHWLAQHLFVSDCLLLWQRNIYMKVN